MAIIGPFEPHPALDKRIKADVSKWLNDTSDVDSVQGMRFFEEEGVDGLIFDYMAQEPMDNWTELAFDADAPSAKLSPGNRKSVTLRRYGGAISYTEITKLLGAQCISDNLAGMDEAYKVGIELELAAMYHYCLDGSTVPSTGGRPIVDTLTSDGLEFFHPAHTFKSSAITNANCFSSTEGAKQFSVSSLLAMTYKVRQWQAANGMPQNADIVSVVVGDELVEKANVVLHTEKDPETANNAENLLKYANNGTRLQKVEHWGMMGTSDFMLKTGKKKGRPAWVFAYLNGRRQRKWSYQSASGTRQVVAWESVHAVTCVYPAHFTNRAAS